MNNVVAMQPLRPRDYSPEQLSLVRRTIAKDTNPDEFDMFIEVCRRVGLDPFRRQIYANVYNKDKADKRQMVLITSIDGFRAVAARNGDYRPDDQPPMIEYDEAEKDPKTNPKGIVRATVKCFKRDDRGEWFPVVGTAEWEAFAPLTEKWAEGEDGRRRPTGEFELDPKNNFWKRMGPHMLAKCAEAQAIRRGWPEDLSGLYAPEEMHQADVIDATATEIVERHQTEQRMAKIGGSRTVPIVWRYGGEIEMVPVGQMADRALEMIAGADSAAELAHWRDTNREGLRQFWGMSASDALAVKDALEKKIAALDNTRQIEGTADEVQDDAPAGSLV